MLLTDPMTPLALTITQLNRPAAIKDQLQALNKEVRAILAAPATSGGRPKKTGAISASVKKKIAAAQKARWATVQGLKPATLSVKPAAQAQKKTVSRATKAKLSAKLKAYWAAKKKSGKK